MASTGETSGIIAQLTRGRHRNTKAAASSPQLPGRFADVNSTTTSFQPEHESTQQFDTAADNRSWAGEGGIEGQSEGSMDDDSRSIEIGRGLKRSTRHSSGRHGVGHDFSEEQLLDLGDDSLYNLTATPPTARGTVGRKSNDLRKQASVRRAMVDRDAEVTKTSDIVPVKTRSTANAGARRTLSDMHARVNAISDSSFMQPEDVVQKPRGSRFSGARVASGNKNVPTRFTAGAGLGSRNAQTPRRAVSEPDGSIIGNQTAQSFMLPDLPNIAELVSGVRKDGTPVFSRTSKPRSRFTSATYAGANQQVIDHARVNTVSLPEEEKAIFTSLQLLKEKVAQLESDRSEAVKRADEYEAEISGLRSQVQMERRLRRPDSGFGTDEERHSSNEWRMERAELQASLKTAHDHLERVERKLSVSDTGLKRITQERDSLITQLGVAFYSNEELKESNLHLAKEIQVLDNQNGILQDDLTHLRDSNKDLQNQLAESEKQHDSNLRQWAVRESELKARAKQRSSVLHSSEEPAARDQQPRRRRHESGQETQNRILEKVEQEVRKARAEAVKRSKIVPKTQERDLARSRSRSRPRQSSSNRHSLPIVSRGSESAERWLDGLSDVESLDRTATQGHTRATTMQQAPNVEEDSQDITYLSFLDPIELSALRKKLETERLASKQHRSTSALTTSEEKQTTHAIPRKSSMRDIAAGQDHTSATTKETLRNVRVQSPATADHISYSNPLDDDAGNTSVLSTSSRRPQRSKSFEEMTSAFILPDITMDLPPHTSTSSNAAITHDKKSCTTCHPTTAATSIPDPIPVSTREDIDATTATVRPAQDPKIALATVLKQLQDEIVHLKLSLGAKEREYERHDPALGKRKRLALKEELARLVGEIEKRSEWVYGLYDVVEGAGEMGGGVEETLRGLAMGNVKIGRGKSGGEADEVESLDIVEGSVASY